MTRSRTLVTWVLLWGLSMTGMTSAITMKIAAIFDEGGNSQHEIAFNHAVRGVNRNSHLLKDITLEAETMYIYPDNTFQAEKKTCHLLQKGVVALFGPRSKSASEHMRSIADQFEIPFIETRWNYRSQRVIGTGSSGYAFNLHPDITALGGAYLDVLEAYQWETVTILYQDNDSFMTLKPILEKTAKISHNERFRLVVKQLVKNQNGYRDVLKEIFMSESNLIVLDCEKHILEEVLKQCQQVGLISQGYSFFLTSLDGHTVNLDDFKYGGTNITSFRMVNIDNPEVKNIVYRIVEDMVDRQIRMNNDIVPEGHLDTTTALIYDSVNAFALALNELTSVQQVIPSNLDCDEHRTWSHGNSLMNYMKMVEFVGLTGPIKFDTAGLRTQFELDLMELQLSGLEEVGSWNSLDHLMEGRKQEDKAGDSLQDPMANKTFVITTILNDPFAMLVETHKKMTGNARFEGISIDLADEISKLLGFNYTIKLVDDGNYGKEVSPDNWNGMLGEVMDEVADFCIADISVTAERAQAFAFSMPWMNLGISILYVKPRAAPPSLLAFLDPFTTDVYVLTLIMFVTITLLIYVLARFSPIQWEEPSNCIRDPTELTNQYNFLNSFWFILGAFMQQGSDVCPESLSVRFCAGMWFFFALIMIASYTANLAAFLTVETLERPIESVEDLAAQSEIWYGAVNGGSTYKFFEKSNEEVYQKINAFMSGMHQSEVMMSSNDNGIEKVEESEGKYAFFMESAQIEYIQERQCKLSQVGGLLDNKGYGIATKKGTPYKNLLDQAILKLLESGTLHKLKVKWWKQKRGGGACANKGGGGGVNPLGLANVAGVFLVTMIGCAIAGVFAILEFLYGTRQSAKDGGKSWQEEMRGELDFIFQCWGNTRELSTGGSSSSSSSSSSESLVDHPSHMTGYSRHKMNSLGVSPTLDPMGHPMIPESPYRPFLPQEPAYAAKSCVSHKSEESKSTKLDSEEDEQHIYQS